MYTRARKVNSMFLELSNVHINYQVARDRYHLQGSCAVTMCTGPSAILPKGVQVASSSGSL